MTNDKNNEYAILKKALEVRRFWDKVHEYDRDPNQDRSLDRVLEENIQICTRGDPKVEKELRKYTLNKRRLYEEKRKKREKQKTISDTLKCKYCGKPLVTYSKETKGKPRIYFCEDSCTK